VVCVGPVVCVRRGPGGRGRFRTRDDPAATVRATSLLPGQLALRRPVAGQQAEQKEHKTSHRSTFFLFDARVIRQSPDNAG
jgi:hypothetical protein